MMASLALPLYSLPILRKWREVAPAGSEQALAERLYNLTSPPHGTCVSACVCAGMYMCGAIDGQWGSYVIILYLEADCLT